VLASKAKAGDSNDNDDDAAADFVDAALEARAKCAATFASYPNVIACLEATPADRLYTSRVMVGPCQKLFKMSFNSLANPRFLS